MDAQEVRQFSSDDLTPEVLAMTLEEFLESDLEEYEYVKGELVSGPLHQQNTAELAQTCFYL